MKNCPIAAIVAIMALGLSATAIPVSATFTPSTDFTPLFIPKTKIYAQALVEQLMAKNPELLSSAIHAVPPGGGDKSCIIACNMPERLGSPDTEGDMSAMLKGDTILNPKLPESERLLMLTPLKDASGKIIGTLGMVFKYTPNGDQTKSYLKGVALRDELQKQIPNLAALYDPVK